MKRLLTLADYENPYLTMHPAYEAAVLEVFADLVAKGLVYRALKPVHWSIANQTALADAELEYENREDTSVYVLFEVVGESRDRLLYGFRAEAVPKEASVSLMIWTTTPWTLPANLAIAVHERHEYSLVQIGEKKFAVVASDLVDKVTHKAGLKDRKPIGQERKRGTALSALAYTHPFIRDARDRRVVTADYVTLEDGTGLVHTAPGHGVEDYQTGLRENLDIYCPVQPDGTFDATAPDWLQGTSVWDANKIILKRLHDSSHLFHQETITHSYPHDWRSKTPVIFRATEQWFIGVQTPIEDGASLQNRAFKCHRQRRPILPRVGPQPHARYARIPPRLVHQPPTRLGPTHPRLSPRPRH